MTIQSRDETAPRSLDDWYRLLGSIYFDRNFYRSTESLLCHLVEVVGGLSIVGSGKRKTKVEAEDFLAKSFGWWLALCEHVGIRSVDEIVWMKFPNACTYCRQTQHDDVICARRRAESGGHPDWAALAELAASNVARHPTSLTGWQEMFQKIYPRSNSTAHERNFSHLTEELGELAEAVRSLPLKRTYFLSEASDVFAWLMGVANQIRVDSLLKDDNGIWATSDDPLGDLLWNQYPGRCRYCWSRSCKCAPFPKATRGRIVHEGPDLTKEAEASFFSLREKLEFLDVGDEFILVAGRQIGIDQSAVRDAELMLGAFGSFIDQHRQETSSVRGELRIIQDQLAMVSEYQVITQERVDEVLGQLAALPGPIQQLFLNFATGIGAGLWVELIKARLGV